MGTVPYLSEPDRLCPRERPRRGSDADQRGADGRGRAAVGGEIIIDLYGAADILVAEVQLQRLYPGGPARARFIARHGPDNQIVGGFTLTAPNSDAIPP